MIDVLRLARDRREQLTSELAGIDRFVRMAEELLTSDRGRNRIPEVDPFQARFNSGEVLPPLQGDDDGWSPAGEGGGKGAAYFVRAATGKG